VANLTGLASPTGICIAIVFTEPLSMPVFAITATLAAVPISSAALSSFTIPIVLVLKMCLTVTKSKGLIMMSGLIVNQKLSMVFGNLSDASVLPISLSLPFFCRTRLLSSCMVN
jgi:hypothetical protein